MKNPNLTRNKTAHLLWRLGALVLALAMTAGSVLLPSSAATKEELEKEMQAAEDRIVQREAEIDALRSAKQEQEKLVEVLAAQVEEIEQKTALIDEGIALLNSSVQQLHNKIAGLNAQIEDCRVTVERIQTETNDKREAIAGMQDELKERLCQQYMTGPVSNLQLLLSSPDLSSFLTIAEYIRVQAERDAALRSQLEDDMADLTRLEKEQEEQQKALEAMRADVELETDALELQLQEQKRAKRDLDAQHDRISDAQHELFEIIAELDKETATAKKLLKAEREAVEAFEAEIDALLAKKKQDGTIVPDDLPIIEGQMIWPVPTSNCYISSPFGDRENRNYSHAGLDISAKGANYTDYPIQAALDGVVLDYGWHKSRGNYVVLYHGYYAPTGKEIKTTYMHLRSIDSSIRDNANIKAGKVIGIMGSTGNSTGAHLHFQVNEISSNGSSTAVNPLKYVSNPYK